ncbi:hypothetical protein B0H21DRAFT_130675 [Amylocystis lapponica]|nr:hypothetical protein B0H21DRAFT_130675 [Amylocystis lapponica]
MTSCSVHDPVAKKKKDVRRVRKAEVLKGEGNALYMRGEHRAAHAKYTDAITLSRNAILYANRAAASLSLNEYLDAACDAHQATQLDPKYSKGWGRLAKAYDVCSWLTLRGSLHTDLLS